MLSGPELFSKNHTPTSIVILLHGYGDDGEGFFGLAKELQRFLPETHFLSPNGIYPFENAPFGRQWCSLKDMSEPNLIKELNIAAPAVNEFIDYQLQRFKLADSKLVLVGFSQGAIVSLHIALRRAVSIGGVIGLSGMLVAPYLLKTELKSRPLVTLVHGAFDEVIPVSAMYRTAEALKAENISTETLVEPIGHSISQAGLNFITKMLRQYLGY
jgi:phospholipase/carboxylesterase